MSDSTLPNLRFPAFNDNWEKKKFDSFCIKISSGKSKALEQGKYAVHGSTGILGFTDDFSHDGANILVARVGANAGLLNCVEGKVGVTDNTLVIELLDQELQKFYYYLLDSSNLNKYVFGTGQPLITGGILKGLNVQLPQSKTEKQKIADFLSLVDKKISLLKEKHALLEQYKKGVMQKLFSQEIRFKDENGNDFPDWVEDRLDSFVVKASDPVKVDPDATYKEIGVRSHAKGVFHKKPIKGHELGNKRVFRVHPKAFIVNIVFAWEHAVALTSEAETGFIASHRFPMFVPKEERIDLRYFTIFFKSKRGKHLLGLASPGGAGRNKTLGQSNFAELKLTLPCLEEQVRIADLYESLDNKAKLITQQIDHTQTFKKGLFQQMFV